VHRARLPFLLLASLLARAAGAQEEVVGKPYWVSTPPGAAGLLTQATEAIAREEWPAVARAVQGIFDRFPEAFVKRGAGEAYVGARQRCIELFATLPPLFREAYERESGHAAEAMLREGLGSGDRALLLQVVRRYEPTDAGLAALFALADHALLRGLPTDARMLLRRIPRLHPGAARGAPYHARVALAAARDHAAGGPAPEEGEQPPEGGHSPEPGEGGWPMVGGDARRSRIAPPLLARGDRGPVPRLFGDPQWSVAVSIQERLWDRPPRPSTGFAFDRTEASGVDWDRRWRDYIPIQPVIARGKLIYHDGREIWAVNLYTGEIAWGHPPRVEVTNEGRTNLSLIFSPVVADGIVYAALEVPMPYSSQRLQQVPITYYLPERRLIALDIETGTRLWSHDEKSLAATPAPGNETLQQLSIIGPPLVRGDTIYAVASYSEGTFHTLIVAAERHTGRLLYATRINTGQQELNLFGRQLQECAATPVAEADGILYFGTNMGIFAAADALLGTPVWASAYPIEPIPSTYFWFEAPRRWAHFDNGPPLLAPHDTVGGQVIVAPADGTAIVSFHRATGRLLWSIPWRRGGAPAELPFAPRILHGADAERVYLGGSGGVAAVALRSDPQGGTAAGKVLWTQLASPEVAAVGRGIVAEDGLWVPIDGGVLQIDLKSGKLLGSFPRRGPDEDEDQPCHLVWGDGVLISAGSEALVARYDGNDVATMMNERVRRDPDGVSALLAAGDLHLATGGVSQAVRHYTEAIRRAVAGGRTAAERRARQGHFRALLRRAEQVFETEPEKAAAEFEAAFRNAPDERSSLAGRRDLESILAVRALPDEREWRLRNLREVEKGHAEPQSGADGVAIRAWALGQMAAILVEMKQSRRALAAWHQILEIEPAGADAQRANREIRRLLASEGRKLYEPYEKRATQLFATALAAGDLEALESGLRLYANAEAAEEASLELAQRRLRGGLPERAVQQLREFLIEHADSPRAPLALWWMAQALDAYGSPGPALASLQRLRDRHGDTLLPRADGAHVPARELVRTMLEREPYASLARSALRRHLEPPLHQRFMRTFDTSALLDIPDLLGTTPEPLRDTVFVKLGSTILAIDSTTGANRVAFEFGNREPISPLVFAGARLVGLTESEIVLFDAATGALAERRPFPDRGRGVGLIEGHGQLFAIYRGGSAPAPIGLAAIHPVDGSALWTLAIPAEAPGEMVVHRHTIADRDRVLVFSENPGRLTVVNATSGAIEKRIALGDGRLAFQPKLLPDGRLLAALKFNLHTRGAWEPSYSLTLVDPEGGVLWSHRPPADGENRLLTRADLFDGRVVAVEATLERTLLDLRDGSPIAPPRPLDLADVADGRLVLEHPQIEHESLLLMLTRGRQEQRARLYGFEAPFESSKFHIDLTATDQEQVELVRSEGVLAFLLTQQTRRGARPPRLLLVDPLAARRLQELLPDPLPGREDQWWARVQGGVLLLGGSSSYVLYAFGPK